MSLYLPLQSQDDQIQVIGNLKNISMASSKLLLAAKSLSVDPGAANAKNLLAVAARCDKMQIVSSFVSNANHTAFASKLNQLVLHMNRGPYSSLLQVIVIINICLNH